jgi:hypothetical protein
MPKLIGLIDNKNNMEKNTHSLNLTFSEILALKMALEAQIENYKESNDLTFFKNEQIRLENILNKLEKTYNK